MTDEDPLIVFLSAFVLMNSSDIALSSIPSVGSKILGVGIVRTFHRTFLRKIRLVAVKCAAVFDAVVIISHLEPTAG